MLRCRRCRCRQAWLAMLPRRVMGSKLLLLPLLLPCRCGLCAFEHSSCTQLVPAPCHVSGPPPAEVSPPKLAALSCGIDAWVQVRTLAALDICCCASHARRAACPHPLPQAWARANPLSAPCCAAQIACPRLSIDWGEGFAKPTLNPYEVRHA